MLQNAQICQGSLALGYSSGCGVEQLSPWVGGLRYLLVMILSPEVMSCFKRCMTVILSLPIVDYHAKHSANPDPGPAQCQLHTLHTGTPPSSLTLSAPEYREKALLLRGFVTVTHPCHPGHPSIMVCIKIPPQARVLNTSSPADGCVLGGCETTFWDIVSRYEGVKPCRFWTKFRAM